MTRSPVALILPCAALLGACGGGSDGGPLPVDYAAVNRTNAPEIASAVMSTAFAGDGLGDFAWLMAIGAPVAQPAASSARTDSAVTLATSALEESVAAAFQTPIAPTTSPCAVAGTVEVSGDIATTQTLTPGDNFTFVFTDCDDGTSVVSGTFSMTITSFAGDFVSGSFTFEVDLLLEAFTVSVNGEPAAMIDGDASIMLDFTSAPSLALTVESTSLSVTVGASTHTLERYTLSQTSDSVTDSYSLLVSGRVSSSEFAGVVDFETTAALESGDGGPALTGRIEISGNGGALLTVIVLDSVNVRLEIDENGDGVVDAVVDTTWDAITSP